MKKYFRHGTFFYDFGAGARLGPDTQAGDTDGAHNAKCLPRLRLILALVTRAAMRDRCLRDHSVTKSTRQTLRASRLALCAPRARRAYLARRLLRRVLKVTGDARFATRAADAGLEPALSTLLTLLALARC